MSQAPALSARKALGAFYTPGDAAHFLASWAMRADGETLVEPSLGDGSFVRAAVEVAAARGWARPHFRAGDIDPSAAAAVRAQGLLAAGELQPGDFLEAPIRPADAVIGNPPYVRLRALPARQAATAARAIRADIGAPMLSSGSVWMPFVARATHHLKPGGRLALVLPWDFTYVKYARPLWSYLGRTFGALRVVRVRERVFPDISQDVLLLLADGKGRSSGSVEFEAYRTIGDLVGGRPERSARLSLERIAHGDRVFQEALLPDGVIDALATARVISVPARELITFNIGYVSGDKDFFHPGDGAALPATSLRPALINARRLRGGGLRTSGLTPEAQTSLWIPPDGLSEKETRYVRRGERLGVHRRYKCRVREPWYRVPGVKVPDLVLSVFAHRPLLMVNDGGHVASNSLLCGYLRHGDPDSFAAGWYTSLTLLSAELEVHSLGGGVLVVVPNEAGNVLVAKPRTVPKSGLTQVAAALRAGDLDAAYAVGDGALKRRLGTDVVGRLRAGVTALESWRVARPLS